MGLEQGQNSWHKKKRFHNIYKINKKSTKGCQPVKQVMRTLKRRDAERRIPVVRMEINYELATLYEALNKKDVTTVQSCKDKLENLRREMMELEG